MTYGELPKKPKPGVVLACGCGGEYSAHAGDYRNVPAKERVTCGQCGEPMRLYQRRVRYVRISPKKAEASQ